jgi:hypothetical protein
VQASQKALNDVLTLNSTKINSLIIPKKRIKYRVLKILKEVLFMYLNKKQIKAVQVALDVIDILIVYWKETEELRSTKDILEDLMNKSKKKLKG